MSRPQMIHFSRATGEIARKREDRKLQHPGAVPHRIKRAFKRAPTPFSPSTIFRASTQRVSTTELGGGKPLDFLLGPGFALPRLLAS